MNGTVLEDKSVEHPGAGRHTAAPARHFGEKLSTLDGLLRHGKLEPGAQSSKKPGYYSEGGMFQQLLGVDDHSGEHTVLSRLLGLDREVHLAPAKKAGTEEHHGFHMPIWVSSLQHAKLSHLFEGMHITANMGFGLLFAFLICWLFLLYFIRHHEPFAGSVLGHSAAQSSRIAVDRQVINGSHIAMPYPTRADDTFFVPSPGQPEPQATPVLPQTPDLTVAAPVQSPQLVPSAMVPQAPSQTLSAGAVNMPEATVGGERLKTFVSR